MLTAVARAMKTPRCSRKLRGNFRASAPCGVAIATSICSCPVGRPRPPPAGSAPEPLSGKQRSSFPANEPGTRSCSKPPADASCNAPCKLRGHSQPLIAHATLSVPALFAAQVPGQPQCGFRGVDPGRGIDFFESQPASPHALSTTSRRRRSGLPSSSRSRRDSSNRVASGHSISPPRGGSTISTRARREERGGVRAARTLD